MGIELACPICDKNYKGKIGVGVHLKRSHTSEERSILYLSYLTDLLPTILATAFVIGIGTHLVETQLENLGGKG